MQQRRARPGSREQQQRRGRDADHGSADPSASSPPSVEPASGVVVTLAGNQEDMYGLVYDDVAYTFRLSTRPQLAGRTDNGLTWDETIESVLASTQWR